MFYGHVLKWDSIGELLVLRGFAYKWTLCSACWKPIKNALKEPLYPSTKVNATEI